MSERVTSIKGLPLTELSITAVASITDVYENTETGNQIPVVEMEILNQADWERFDGRKEDACRCALCGQGLKIACAVTHKPSGHGYWIGRGCAAKLSELRHFGPLIKNATVAMAQRLACDKRESNWLAAHPDSIGIITWAKRPGAPRICKNLCEQLRGYGKLSDKQVELLEKIRQRDIDRRAKATGTATAGRQVITGKVIKVQVFDDEFTRHKKNCRILIDLGNGVRLMGNTPEYVTVTDVTLSRAHEWSKVGHQAYTWEIIKVGDTVSFRASVEQSNDNLFGFWKRPANFLITELAAIQAPAAPQVSTQAATEALYRLAGLNQPGKEQ